MALLSLFGQVRQEASGPVRLRVRRAAGPPSNPGQNAVFFKDVKTVL